ncbi:uncharacterized protein CANTADRAFT_47063 [Suhomyces tanzawaensis NRRL Y-17324]|uniref:FHA domain-containing protein n=1 Tax=Suhomyces tanzawaensis NRRL Y-17324 TaxID=984487 RepID=A0A1E4SMA8_9ASCO|nr:uncharacterized protein CANTADRAFT_47063 [Suhomyces tanzawaensis NRRL Y-17324]ODV80664.1 hypothetical protein CANTADRAFT_47063 [Suhomyces tanzawaensis NRRL Y-17324]
MGDAIIQEVLQKSENEHHGTLADQLLMDELQDLDIGPLDRVKDEDVPTSKTVSRSQSPAVSSTNSRGKISQTQKEIRQNSTLVSVTSELALGNPSKPSNESDEASKISAYARLDFENFTFFVQTLQVVLGRKSADELIQSSHHAVDVHLSSKKAISRRHAKIFYNFGTQRFEISILGRNGAFVDDSFVEKGITVPLSDGTKIQIGDLPFQFVLPSIEPNEEDSLVVPSKQFNPSDAINLRSNLYNTNNKKPVSKPKKEPIRRKDSIPTDPKDVQEPKEDHKSKMDPPKIEKPDTPRKSFSKEERRDSILKIRRLSNARRKSLASAANDEINDILKELGVSSIDAIDEEDSELFDSQIQAMLADHENSREEIGLDGNLLRLSQYSESAIEEEEDEIDQLVKQHNLEQGVVLDDEDNTNDLDMDLSILDQEIANLGPLIDAHNQDLIKEKEERRRRLEIERNRKRQQIQKKQMNKAKEDDIPIDTALLGPNSSNSMSGHIKSGPLMGKVVPPRMGKAASIQPPANRLYNRPLNGLPKSQVIDSRLGANTMTGLPNHLVQLGGTQSPVGLPMKLPPGMIYNGLQKPVAPPRAPPPKLEVAVIPIISEPSAVRPRPPLRAITVSGKATLTTFGVPKTVEEPSKFPKVPKRGNQSFKKLPKKVYTLDEIPEQYRSKPSISLPVLITNALKVNRENGLTLNELYESIKDAYPYYKYCPDGWQFSVSHNVKLNKIFKRKFKRNNEWVYIIDDLFINEREKVRKKQQEMIAARIKAADLRAEELKQKQRFEAQQAITHNIVGRNFSSPYGLPVSGSPQSQFISHLHKLPVSPGIITGVPGGVNGQKPKTIAELASEIRRDGVTSKAPMYFKPQSPVPVAGAAIKREGTSPMSNTIKAQLAANRSNPTSQSPPPPSTTTNSPTPPATSGPMNQDTKKSLTYLQKELFTLYKARKLSYNTATTTEIITKALATTIAQVNVIGAKAGCGDNALSFLVERAPQQVSKILDIALTKSIREKQGTSSIPSSRAGTPGPSTSQAPSPTKPPAAVVAPKQAESPPQTTERVASSATEGPSVAHTSTTPPETVSPSPTKTVSPSPASDAKASVSNLPGSTGSTPASYVSPRAAAPALAKPPLFGAGLSRPPSYKSSGPSLSKPQSFAKPGGLSRPPTFLSNKPAQRPAPSYYSTPGSSESAKREPEQAHENESPRKIMKTE